MGLAFLRMLWRFPRRRLTLVIDVPRVSNGGAAFDRMMKMATTLAGELGGDVVDDNRAPFGAEAAAIIRGQIGQFRSDV